MERMKKLDSVRVKNAMTTVALYLDKCDDIRHSALQTTGETRQAFCVVYRDYLWKLQRLIGELWYSVCGVEELNPFESVEEAVAEPIAANAVRSEAAVEDLIDEQVINAVRDTPMTAEELGAAVAERLKQREEDDDASKPSMR